MYEIWRNETGEVVETHPGPWSETQKRIAELNAKGLGVSGRKAGAQAQLFSNTFVQEVVHDQETVAADLPIYVAYCEVNHVIVPLGASIDLERLLEMHPGALIDQI